MANTSDSKSSPSLTSVRRGKSLSSSGARLTLAKTWMWRNIWIFPLLGLAMMLFVALWLRNVIEAAMEEQKKGELTALIDADVTALRLWLRTQEANAQAIAQVPDVRRYVLELVQVANRRANQRNVNPLLRAPQKEALTETLKPWLDTLGYRGWVVLDRSGVTVSSNIDSLIGQEALPEYLQFARQVFNNRARVSLPFPSKSMIPDEWGRMSTGVPTMFAAAPIFDDNDRPAALIAVRIRPDQEFTHILNTARFGETGETYAFDSSGLMLSRSRFEDQLKQIGLQVDSEFSRSVLTIQIRDPGVDLTTGKRAAQSRNEQPLTWMAQHATGVVEEAEAITESSDENDDAQVEAKAKRPLSGINVAGYRDYRGVEVIGARRWLPRYHFGVATEIDKVEAYRPIYILRNVFWGLFGLLSLATLGMFALTFLAKRMEANMRDAVVAAGKLGQYALETRIGAGGMGTVYRGRHAMLRRPTAIKLLEPSKTTELSIARFEREVQLTSQLNHPNTITIYDYGRTPEGVFYYAMEFLDGLSLQTLVEIDGPQPDGRVIPILLQVCGSLLEAHSAGLIHRDIKPANIMLTRRGGMNDFVKLLDFGLVKPIDHQQATMLTAAESITGTPLYMPPEMMSDAHEPDARSDLYALGAVGYFMLTGRPVFEGSGIIEVMRGHLEQIPLPPSQRTDRPISANLDAVILKCLSKSPNDRPASAAQLAEWLQKCPPKQPWTVNESEAWWSRYQGTATAETVEAKTMNLGQVATIDLRPGHP